MNNAESPVTVPERIANDRAGWVRHLFPADERGKIIANMPCAEASTSDFAREIGRRYNEYPGLLDTLRALVDAETPAQCSCGIGEGGDSHHGEVDTEDAPSCPVGRLLPKARALISKAGGRA